MISASNQGKEEAVVVLLEKCLIYTELWWFALYQHFQMKPLWPSIVEIDKGLEESEVGKKMAYKTPLI